MYSVSHLCHISGSQLPSCLEKLVARVIAHSKHTDQSLQSTVTFVKEIGVDLTFKRIETEQTCQSSMVYFVLDLLALTAAKLHVLGSLY